MAQVLEALLGLVLGIGLIGTVFWFAFRRAPDAREPPFSGTDANSWWSSGDSGPSDGHGG